MDSLRDSCACIGLTGDISILQDYFGFTKGRFDSPPDPRGLPPDPTGAEVRVSLLRQIGLLKGEHYDINIIRIGEDNFSNNDYTDLDYTVFRIRNIYNQQRVGIGKVEWYFVLSADADGLDSPTTKGDLRDITHHWTVDNDAIDVFLPSDMNVGQTLGYSPIGGPCNKSGSRMNGSVVGLWGSEQTGRSFSHEVGHYLGLFHRNHDTMNLMCQTSKVQQAGIDIRDAIQLTDHQGHNVKNHCFIHDGC